MKNMPNMLATSSGWTMFAPSPIVCNNPQPNQEDPPLTDEIAHPAGQQQQPAERDEVGVDDPGQAVLREVQLVLDGRQRDVHDGDV